MVRVAFGLLIACLLVGTGGTAAGGPDGPLGADALGDAEWAARLIHPIAEVRRAAESQLAADLRGASCAAALAEETHAGLRASAWRVFSRRPAWIDSERALSALEDPDPRVAGAAAGALRALGDSAVLPEAPRIPAGRLSGQAVGLLAAEIAVSMEMASAERISQIAFRLGEGVAPCIALVAFDRGVHISVRRQALAVLARIGGPGASATMIAMVGREDVPDRSALFGALARLELNESERRALHTEIRGAETGPGWHAAIRFGRAQGWRERGPLLRLLAVHPPDEAEDREALRVVLMELLWRRRRRTSMVVDAARALLALGEPDDEALRAIIHACDTSGRRGGRGRGQSEELGALMVLLEPHKNRAAAIDDLEEMLSDREADHESTAPWETDLPRSVEAWARYLLGEDEPERLQKMATSLIFGDDEEPPWPARRLGARLWQRLGRPPADLVRRLLADPDPFVRRAAQQFVEVLPDRPRAAARAAGLLDSDLTVLLEAARGWPRAFPAVVLERLLEAGVEGTRGQRAAAWSLLSRAMGEQGTGGLDMPDGRSPLDLRIRAAHRARKALLP